MQWFNGVVYLDGLGRSTPSMGWSCGVHGKATSRKNGQIDEVTIRDIFVWISWEITGEFSGQGVCIVDLEVRLGKEMRGRVDTTPVHLVQPGGSKSL